MPYLPPITLKAWELLERFTEAWAVRQGALAASLENAPEGRSQWQARVDLDADSCRFAWERESSDGEEMQYGTVTGAGQLVVHRGPRPEGQAPEAKAQRVTTRLWLFPREVQMSGPLVRGRRQRYQVYEGEFHDGQVDWRIHAQKTFDSFSLQPVLMPSKFERLLRRFPYLVFLVG